MCTHMYENKHMMYCIMATMRLILLQRHLQRSITSM